MITESAIVTHRNGSRVELKLQRASACGGCELNQGCGTGALGRLLGHRSKPVVIETDRELEPGDQLVLGLSETTLVKASLTIYGLPLLGMVIAGLLAAWGGLADGFVALIAISGFFAGFKFATWLSISLEDDHFAPYIIDIQVNPGRQSGS
jgi:sigma-E factor negative regulatory protein RseC